MSAPAPDTSIRAIRSLPLLTLHLTERCNSRCISCDYWRHGKHDISAESVANLLPELQRLGTHTVLLSGGEPLIHPEWMEIAQLLKARGIELWLVTSGLSLAKHADAVSELFQNITVSLDGPDRETYVRIRGVNAFDKVCDGIRTVVERNIAVGIRVTVQRENFKALPELVRLARRLEVDEISFLSADVRSEHSFGRQADFENDVALRSEDLPVFATVLEQMENEFAHEFATGFIAERPAKLRRLLDYFRANCGLGEFPPVRCNAPEFSAVLDVDGAVRPCFFIASPVNMRSVGGLSAAIRSQALSQLRAAVAEQRRPECVTCVCSLWREPNELDRRAIGSLRRSADVSTELSA